MSNLSALVGKTAALAQDDGERLVIVLADGGTLAVSPCPSEESTLLIDYDDGACHSDAGPVCLMGS